MKKEEKIINCLKRQLETVSSLRELIKIKVKLVPSDKVFHLVIIDDLHISSGLVGEELLNSGDGLFCRFSLWESEPEKRVAPVFSIKSSTKIRTWKNQTKYPFFVLAIDNIDSPATLIRFEGLEIMRTYATALRLIVSKLKDLPF